MVHRILLVEGTHELKELIGDLIETGYSVLSKGPASSNRLIDPEKISSFLPADCCVVSNAEVVTISAVCDFSNS